MYLLLPYFYLATGLIFLCFGHTLYKKEIFALIGPILGCCWFINLYLFYEIIFCQTVCIVELNTWFNLGFVDISLNLKYDTLSCIMLFLIISISSCVILYSLEYMGHDPQLYKFISYLFLFTFFMIILVTADNLLLLFIAWEWVGAMSYLLINFWTTRTSANKAAMKAFIMNKIGDVFFLLAIVLLLYYLSSVDLTVINAISWAWKADLILYLHIFGINIDSISIILFLMLIGVCAKSAQIGLHTWLPDAMEGPTPVSALIHAATMVTAGVFLLLRLVYLLKYSEHILLVISFLGGITAFIAGTIGLFQNDIKKVIAYSTCSQLGFMVLSCGLNNYSASLFHLMNHGFFKALLFLGAGAIIHSMLDQQDIRRMGMLVKYLPVSYIMILVGSLTIMGIPFLTGFYSKEFILGYAYASNIYLSLFLYWLSVMSAVLTTIYSTRLLFLTFYNEHNSYFNVLYNKKTNLIVIKESNFLILIVLIILLFGSIFIGFIFKELFIGMGTDTWINTLDTESYKDNQKNFEAEFIPTWIKLIPVIFTILALILSYFFVKFYIIIMEYFYIIYYYLRLFFVSQSPLVNNSKNLKKISNIAKNSDLYSNKFYALTNIILFFKKLIYNGYYFNEIYNYFLYKNKNLSNILLKNLEKGIIEFKGYMSIVNNIKKILYFFSKRHKLRIDVIVFVIILGVFSIIFCLLLLSCLTNYKIFGLLLLLIVLEIF